MALLMTVWVLALIAALSLGITAEFGVGATLTRNMVESARARALADGAFWQTLADMLDNPGAGIQIDGTPRELLAGDATITTTVQDEAGKLDLNAAQQDRLARLFQVTGVPQRDATTLAAAIEAYRVQARLVSSRQNGETRSSARPFLSVPELRLVPGITPDIYVRVRPYLTVWSGAARPEAASASRIVRMALSETDASPEVLDMISARRSSGRRTPRGQVEEGDASHTAAGAGKVVTILTVAKMSSGTIFTREAAVAFTPRSDLPFRILSWSTPALPPQILQE